METTNTPNYVRRGRKPIADGSLKNYPFYIAPEDAEILSKFGRGNRSQGLRDVLGHPTVRAVIDDELSHLAKRTAKAP